MLLKRKPERKSVLTRDDKRRARRLAWLIVLGMAAAAALCLWVPTWPLWEPPAVLPAESQTVVAASAGMDDIRIDAVLDPDALTLSATQTMTLTNRTGEAQPAVVLRSYSGAYLTEETSPAAAEEMFYASYPGKFSPGGLTLTGVRVNGAIAVYTWLDDAQTVLSVPVDGAWEPDAPVTLTLTYTVQIPECAGRFGYDNGVIALGNVFPTAALYDDGAWRTDTYTPVGDPFLNACANWHVRLTVPEGWRVAATGYAEPAVADGMQTYVMTANAVRDFAMVASDRYHVAAAMEGNVLVAAFADTQQAADESVGYLRKALRSYQKHYGPYVYPSLTAASVSMPLAGAAYPRLIMIPDRHMRSGGQTLEFAVAHETAHQWWQVMVGSDGWREPWQHEALAEYALMDYIGDVYGYASRESAVFSQIEASMRITIPRGVTPASPLDYFAGWTEYTQVTAMRGASFMVAMETMLGKDALDRTLADYVQRNLFGFASREDLTSVLEEAAGRELDGLMTDYLDTYISN